MGLRDRLGWNGCRVLISVRSLEPNHGAWVLFEALRRTLPDLPDVRVVLLGDGTLRRALEERVRSEGLEDRVYWGGQVSEDQLPAYFREADLYVSAAFCDGTSVSLLGAMASGLPVVVTDGAGNREWVRPGIHGWLVPREDPEALADTLRAALEVDASERLRIGATNHREIRERADWNRNFGRLLEAYGELLHA